ncbi:hypothetical protein K503DRAFT_727879 [Rhizopogon vinicolor AM-OR11-026]|uniref:Family A G protein-coupled receptor-like protein n=1 Tax=Rhizopogon vinicolor AM-OR11-026 TaxID=1314800 RepID=A0A1B7MFI5_9AGAM|nr:hypothetical protein K503DRAFT_727879 [Rhizopogon vinicolor AM-OR11-026]
MGISLKGATILSIIIESILYGISIFLFGITLWSLTYQRKSSEISRIMVTAACMLLLLSTLHIVLSANFVWQAFISSANVDMFLEDNNNNTSKEIVNVLETLFGDVILIYRCYIVWQRIEVIIIPIIGWISYVVSAGYTIWILRQMSPTSPLTESIVFQQEMKKWMISANSTALITNLIATSTLAFKLWLVHRRSSGIRTTKSQVYPILLVIIECGALYSMALLTLLVTYLSESFSSYVVLDMMCQIIPITFCLLIVRTAMLRFDDGTRQGLFTSTLARISDCPPTVTTPVTVHINRMMVVDSEVGKASEDSSGRIDAKEHSC